MFHSSIINKTINLHQSKLDVLSEKLKLLNPMLIIEKGYIPVFYKNERISSVKCLNPGDNLGLRFADGEAVCNVIDIKLTES